MCSYYTCNNSQLHIYLNKHFFLDELNTFDLIGIKKAITETGKSSQIYLVASLKIPFSEFNGCTFYREMSIPSGFTVIEEKSIRVDKIN